MKSRSLVEKLEKEIQEIEGLQKHRLTYNVRSIAVHGLLETGAFVARTGYFVLASAISMNLLAANNMTPFEKDYYEEPLHVYEVLTSTGECDTVSSYDVEYDRFSLSFSTGWKVSAIGLYERKEVYFQADRNIIERSSKELLTMSLEELRANFKVTDIKTFAKRELLEEDFDYSEDMVVLGRSFDDYTQSNVVEEPVWREILSVVLHFVCMTVGGLINVEIGKLVFKDRLKRTIARIETTYPIVKEQDVCDLERKVVLMKENLALLKGEDSPNKDGEPTMKIKRKSNIRGV